MKKIQRPMITIDGSKGEGGGQILRSSLSLAMVTGQAFKMINIRANRKKPGLMRQHLTVVNAAAKICDAKVTGAELGSNKLIFTPNKIKGGNYSFAIGSVGSTTLLAQTIIPALTLAEEPSILTIEGITHNMQSPTYDFLKHSYLPVLKKMGIEIEASIQSYGFYPVGGGKVTFSIKPNKALKPIELTNRGKQKNLSAESLFAHLSVDIAKRELNTISNLMGWQDEKLHVRQINNAKSSGNIVQLKLEHDELVETAVSFGRSGTKAEEVAEEACMKAKKYLNSDAAVGIYLADQLLLPMVLAGCGKFTTISPSLHTRSNINVIQQFIPCSIDVEEQEHSWTITINKKGGN
ncbi:MAG: RNA 3'-terminal phosphate cyclase [Candidatus Comchoanobacterales bacterium]